MLKPAFIFTDHTVLQCRRPVYVWGESDAEAVTVSFGDTLVTATVKDGKFMCELPCMEPNIRSSLVFRTENEEITLCDVVTGEVWLAGGQSNMEHPTFCTEYNENDLVTDTDIRLFTVPRLTFYKGDTYGFHFESLHSVDTPWKVCTADEALHFTAIGYFFAHKIRQYIDMPIGIISCNWGATPVETWTREEYLLRDPLARRATDKKRAEIEAVGLDNLISRYTEYQAELKKFCLCYDALKITRERGVEWFLLHAGEGQPSLPMELSFYRFPSVLRESMLERIVPYSFRGVIWHQGESNTSQEEDSKEHYVALYRAMMADWRDAFRNPDMPFYTVQLAGVAWHGDTADYWSGVRDAQRELSENDKNVYMTVSYDLSEPDNIHPAKKQPMGERLAAAALANTYGQDVVWQSPICLKAERTASHIVLTFDNATAWQTPNGEEISGFYLYREDGSCFPSRAEAQGASICLDCPDGVSAVAYGRLNYSYTNLYNEHMLPIVPFKKEL